MTYFAKLGPDHVIAIGPTYAEASAAARTASGWDEAPGSVAPYYLTTIPPVYCAAPDCDCEPGTCRRPHSPELAT